VEEITESTIRIMAEEKKENSGEHLKELDVRKTYKKLMDASRKLADKAYEVSLDKEDKYSGASAVIVELNKDSNVRFIYDD
jgi:hypothetical protein